MKNIVLIISLLLIVFFSNAQPPCGSNPPAGETCATATPICELNGYCGNTYSYVANAWGSTGSAFGCGFLGLSSCPGTGLLNVFCGSVENDSYLKFVASGTSISFDVWVTSSVYGDGIQLIVYSTPNCGNNSVTSYYCQQITPGGGATTVSVSGLIPGNTYYIMIDGFAGDLCDYVIGANSGIAIPVDVVPLSSTICSGQTVNLSASGGNGTYTWNASPDLNTTAGANVIATPPGPGTYNYTVNSATGNPLCPSSTLAIATIIVNNCGCTVTASNSGNVCPGGSVDFTSTNVLGATYSWIGPNGFTSTSQNLTGIIPPLTPGSYNYTVTATVGATNCSSTTTITVYALPIVNAGLNQNVCQGTSVTLSGSGASSYTWDNGGVDGVSFVQALGTITYTVVGTTNGCTNTDQVDVTVTALPTVNSGTYGPVCASSGNISLVGSPIGGTFSGTGVAANSFNTASGTQLITYNYSDAFGCSGTATTTITVNPLPVVTAGVYSAVCVDAANVPLVGTPAGGTYTGTGVTANSFDPSVNTQTVTYAYTDGNGCANTATASITVNPLPIVNAGTYSSVCSDGANVTLVGSPVGGTFSGTGVTGNSFDPSVGTQTITYTYTDGNSCTNSATAVINVVIVSAINAGTYAPVCTGSGNVALVGSPVGGTFSGTGVTGNSFNPASGTQLITYNYSDAFGCSGSSTATITVNPLPVVTAGVYSPVCVDAANVPLVGTPAGGTFTGTGVTANTFDPSVNTQTVTYSYTDGNSCTNTATASITVNPLPFVTAGVYTAVCVDAANVALVGTPAGGTFSGTGVAANSFDPSVGTQTVTYSYTNGNGCTNTATASITVNPLPTIGAGVDQTICLGTSIVLSGTGGTTYSWTGGATNGTSFVPGLGATTYTVTGTNANGCVNTDVVTITVLPLPIAVINANNTSGYPTLTVSFTNTSLNATSYLWSFGNGTIANESTTVGQTSSYSTPGTYQVILSASNGVCTDVDTLPIIVIPFPPPTVHVPNVFTPNGDGINDLFLIETTFATSINVIILNRWGDVIQEQTDFTMKWDGQVKGKDASEGVYFFKYEVTGLNGDVLTGHGDITLIR